MRRACSRAYPLLQRAAHERAVSPCEQTPEHRGGGKPYPVDGECVDQCDCGGTSPCAEYIFDHRGGVVDGRNFTQWFVHEYMVSSETLLHKSAQTGAAQMIGLGCAARPPRLLHPPPRPSTSSPPSTPPPPAAPAAAPDASSHPSPLLAASPAALSRCSWLDDSMRTSGPTEEDKNYIADTGASAGDMQAQTDAYQASMAELKKVVVGMGGFWWQLMDGGGMKGLAAMDEAACKADLRSRCVAQPSGWERMQMYNIQHGGQGVDAQASRRRRVTPARRRRRALAVVPPPVPPPWSQA